MISENAKNYCCEDLSLIENYEKALNDKSQIYNCHHRFEIELNLSQQELIKRDLYWHRPASELIFLTKAEHNSIHFKGENHYRYGKHISEEIRKKISDSVKQYTKEHGGNNKGKIFNEEWRKNLSESHKGQKLSEETKQKISEKVSKTLKGHIISEETRKKISETLKGHTSPNKGKHKVWDNKELKIYHYE